jgi:hypothetical protein
VEKSEKAGAGCVTTSSWTCAAACARRSASNRDRQSGPRDGRAGAVGLAEEPPLDVGGHPLVEHRALVLVRGQQPVEPLVGELVQGDRLDGAGAERGEPGAARGDEGGVLHPTGCGREGGWMHHGERRVGVGAVALGEARPGEPDRRHGVLHVPAVAHAEEHPHGHVAERLLTFAEPVPGRPGEVVHAASEQAEVAPVALDAILDPLAGGADQERGRDVERHVVVAEVGVELGRGVEGEVGPGAVLPSRASFGTTGPRRRSALRTRCASTGPQVRRTRGQGERSPGLTGAGAARCRCRPGDRPDSAARCAATGPRRRARSQSRTTPAAGRSRAVRVRGAAWRSRR